MDTSVNTIDSDNTTANTNVSALKFSLQNIPDRVYSKVDHSGNDERIVLQQNKFNRKKLPPTEIEPYDCPAKDGTPPLLRIASPLLRMASPLLRMATPC